jgi:hypothetical protein
MYVSMRNQILAKIDHRRARLLELERERLMLQGELTAYEDALSYFPDNPQPVEKSPDPADRADDMIDRAAPIQRRKRLPNPWMHALRRLSHQPVDSFGIDDVMREVASQGLEPTRGNVRSQMAAYIDRRLIDRIRDGEFRLTVTGRTELGKLFPHTDEAAGPASSGELAASALAHNQHRQGDAGGGI